MKKLISLLGLLLIASAVFAQKFELKTADKTPCTITLNGDFIVIEETLFGGYINRITIPYMLCLLSRKKSRKDHSAIYQLLYSWIMNMFIP